jgi:hypothetical protein
VTARQPGEAAVAGVTGTAAYVVQGGQLPAGSPATDRTAASAAQRDEAVALIEESRPLTEHTPAVNHRVARQDVDCSPDNLYMGGNDYARNMLISQGCDPAQLN